jgi:ketosteroid isomerase-like protein
MAQAAAFNAHDPAKLADTYSADAIVSSPAPEGWKDQKKDDVEKMHAKLFDNVEGAAMGIVRGFQKGDTAVVEWIGTGTSKKTGKKAGFRAASVMWFDDSGLIKKEHDYLDGATIAIQTGMAPGKARDLVTLPTGDALWIVAKGDASESKIEDNVKDGFRMSLSRGRKAFEENLTPDFVHEDIASPMNYRGRDEAMKEFDMLVKALPTDSVSIDKAWGVTNFALAEFTLKTKHKGQLGALKATGKAVTIHGLDINEFNGDKLAKVTSYTNSIEYLVQIGAMPDPSKMGEKNDNAGKPGKTDKKDAGTAPKAPPPKK